jgi:hypothetical protein
MKRKALPLFSFLLAFVLIIASFGSARADAGQDPVVTPVSGDTDFTSEVIPIASLPGVTELAGGMLVPVGFPAGEAQFGGNGIRVTSMDKGKATACFSISTAAINLGWGGKVGVWNGSKWVQLPTTITSFEETPGSLACATITGNGTYAFIKYVVDSSLLPKMQPCDFGIDYQIMDNYGFAYPPSSYNHWALGFNIPASVPAGAPVTYSIISYDPAWPGTFTSGTSGSTTAGTYWSDAVVFYNDFVSVSQTPGPTFLVRFQFPTLNCYLILEYYDYDSINSN